MRNGITIVVVTVLLVASWSADAQSRFRGPPPPAKASAAIDLTGYWVSVVSEGWQVRMVTPPKGYYAAVPLNAAGRRVADAWDPAKDEATGNQCKAYGAAAIMERPGRLKIAWQDENTLRIETDTGMQTRLLHFNAVAPMTSPPTWQGYSVAQWEYATGQTASTPVQKRQGDLKVVTRGLRAGYLRTNGVPYGPEAVVTEYYQLFDTPNGDRWFVVTTIVDDPRYLRTSYITSTNFKKLADGSGWDPTPCSAK
ncbi:MAG TPA: hypothetical protein VFY39_08065 [Gammaproteobacteria bacterium]|nr:hypothetical protein [Gammaproteobacteria bacterium]